MPTIATVNIFIDFFIFIGFGICLILGALEAEAAAEALEVSTAACPAGAACTNAAHRAGFLQKHRNRRAIVVGVNFRMVAIAGATLLAFLDGKCAVVAVTSACRCGALLQFLLSPLLNCQS